MKASGLSLGTRGDLRADGDSCDSCGLPLAASVSLERVRGPLAPLHGPATSVEVEILFGRCVCGAGWALFWRLGP